MHADLAERDPSFGYTANFTLYDEGDVRRLGQGLARHLLEHEGELPSLEKTFSKIPLPKVAEFAIDGPDQFSADLYDRLKICMRAYNAVDFDSLLSLTVQLFEDHPDVLERYQDRYHYIMIDEYQDTNPVQYRLAKLISSKHNNLCVVGDDDQSIYGWRGAEIKNILQFESETVDQARAKLPLDAHILKAANAVIANNAERHDKELWS